MSSGLAKVQVLLSTYNGEKYLAELLDSVLGQNVPNLDILIRDDGSTDGTLHVLEKYELSVNVMVLQGENLGVAGSFFTLLEASSPDTTYIAFCDQDDVWQTDKVLRAINILAEYGDNTPAMYCSRVTLADENLKILGYSQIPSRGLSFGNALVQNVATGCTIVINNAARQLILKQLPSSAMVHDWWIYLVVSAYGQVVYDNESRILYRQHGGNAIGEPPGLCAKWLKRVYRFARQGGLRFVTAQAAEFREIYGELLPLDKKAILDRFLDGRSKVMGRLRLALWSDTYRQIWVDDFIFRVLVVLNRI